MTQHPLSDTTQRLLVYRHAVVGLEAVDGVAPGDETGPPEAHEPYDVERG